MQWNVITNSLNWSLIDSDGFSCRLDGAKAGGLNHIIYLSITMKYRKDNLVKLVRNACFLAWPEPNESAFPEGQSELVYSAGFCGWFEATQLLLL